MDAEEGGFGKDLAESFPHTSRYSFLGRAFRSWSNPSLKIGQNKGREMTRACTVYSYVAVAIRDTWCTRDALSLPAVPNFVWGGGRYAS